MDSEKPQFQIIQFYLTLAALLTAIFLILSTVIISSILWLPLLLFLSPAIIIIILLIKYTPVGNPVMNYLDSIYEWVLYQSEKPRKAIWGFIYNAMIILYPQTNWKTMNYGYAILNREGKLIKNLKEEDEDERYCLQLYHFVATKFNKLKDLQGLSVLEIGSGRGGGLNYVSQYLNPKKCVGIDLSENQVRFCKTQYRKNKNIQFIQGDADKLEEVKDIQGEEFDILLNIESSHCYGNFDQFLENSAKYVKQGGYLLIADFRSIEGHNQMRQSIENSEQWVKEDDDDITLNVVKSLKLDENRKINVIEENIHSLLQPFFRKFSGLEGSKINKEFQERKTIYLAYVLKRK